MIGAGIRYVPILGKTESHREGSLHGDTDDRARIRVHARGDIDCDDGRAETIEGIDNGADRPRNRGVEASAEDGIDDNARMLVLERRRVGAIG